MEERTRWEKEGHLKESGLYKASAGTCTRHRLRLRPSHAPMSNVHLLGLRRFITTRYRCKQLTPRKLQTKHLFHCIHCTAKYSTSSTLSTNHSEPVQPTTAATKPEESHFGYLQSRHTKKRERASRDSKAEGCSSVRAVVVGALVVGVVTVVVIIVVVLGVRVVVILIAVAAVGSRRRVRARHVDFVVLVEGEVGALRMEVSYMDSTGK